MRIRARLLPAGNGKAELVMETDHDRFVVQSGPSDNPRSMDRLAELEGFLADALGDLEEKLEDKEDWEP